MGRKRMRKDKRLVAAKRLLIVALAFIMATSALSTNAYALEDSKEGIFAEANVIYDNILRYCTRIYGSMKADSKTSFTREEYSSINSYLVVKVIEAHRDFALLDVPGGITKVDITKLELDHNSKKILDNGELSIDGRVTCKYVSDGVTTTWGNRYRFILSPVNAYSVVDIIALEGDVFMNIKDSLPLWEKEMADRGESWRFDAIDTILNRKKVKLDIYIVDLVMDSEPEPTPTINLYEMSKSRVTVSFNKSKARTYAKKYGSHYENYIFCRAEPDCTNFVSQCIWAGYGGTKNYTLPDTPTQNNSVIKALRNLVKNDYRMVKNYWYGRSWRENGANPFPNWSGVENLWDYAVDNEGEGPVATGFNNGGLWSEYSGTIQMADVLQFRNPNKNNYGHSVIVYSNVTGRITDRDNIYVCQHSPELDSRRLSEVIRSYSNNDPAGTPCYMRRMRFYDASFGS